MVDRRGVIACECKLAACFEGFTGRRGNSSHALLDHVKYVQSKGPYSSLDLTRVWHDIRGLSSMDRCKGDDARIDWSCIARCDGLERLYHLASHWDRIDTIVRHRGMRAFAVDLYLEFIARRKHWPGLKRELADLQARPVVDAK